ncbi:hypothetical protein SAMN05444722_1263 [Rhodovulum sp. ES.010]|nr:hypothetical protein SAMN05444722_1263 [Rhodovulum sp. ES.010]
MSDQLYDMSTVAEVLLADMTIFASVFGFFRFVDGIISPALKRDHAAMIRRAADGLSLEMASWLDTSPRVMDGFFGPRLVSSRALIRTGLVSVTLCLIITLIASLTIGHVADWDDAWIAFPLMLLLVNVPADLLFVLKSRLLLRHLAPRGRVAFVLLLLLDIALTVALFLAVLVGASLVMFVVRYVLSGEAPDIDRVLSLPLHRLVSLRADPDVAMGVFFYTTFFTTAWTTVFVLGGIAVHAARFARFSVAYLLDIDGKPMTSIGVLGGSIACLAVWLYGAGRALLA